MNNKKTIEPMLITRKQKMNTFNFNPEKMGDTFVRYVRLIVLILTWTTIALAATAAACVALAGILAVSKSIFHSIF